MELQWACPAGVRTLIDLSLVSLACFKSWRVVLGWELQLSRGKNRVGKESF